MEDSIERPESGDELTSNIRRLTSILLEKLAQDFKEKTIDQTQMRLLGAITLRALRLWEKTRRPNGNLLNKNGDHVKELDEKVRAILGESREGARKDEE